jgi:hypothetical protein
MKTQKREGPGWMPYALAAGFVLLASSAALPHAPGSVEALLSQIKILFS